MVNYKNFSFDFGDSIVQKLPSNITPVALHQHAVATAGLTFHNNNDNSNYTVPASNTFHLVAIQVKHSILARILSVYEADGVDGVIDEDDIMVFNSLVADPAAGHMITWYFNTNVAGKSVAGGKNLNYKVDFATTAPIIIQIIGYLT